MQFYDASLGQGLCQEIDRLCDTTDTSYTRQAKTSRINNALEMVVGWLIGNDGTWQFDDTNYTTLPIGLYTLVEGQNSYAYSDKYLAVEEVAVLTANNSQWHQLKPLDISELGGLSVEEYFGITSTTPKGLPEYYDKQANNIKLYPAPTSTSVTLASGLRVRFKRTASLFTVASNTTDDATVPGFASNYHIILAYMASIPYCMTYKKDRVPLYEKRVMDLKTELLKQEARQEQDKRKIMKGKKISYI